MSIFKNLPLLSWRSINNGKKRNGNSDKKTQQKQQLRGIHRNLCTSAHFKVAEAATCRCSSKKLFVNILQYSQKNTCVGVSFKSCNFIKKRLFSCEYCEILRTVFYRIPPVVASRVPLCHLPVNT